MMSESHDMVGIVQQLTFVLFFVDGEERGDHDRVQSNGVRRFKDFGRNLFNEYEFFFWARMRQQIKTKQAHDLTPFGSVMIDNVRYAH